MAGKPGHGGRPRSTEPRRAYQVKLPQREAEAFDELVRRRAEEAVKAGAKATAASVIHGLIRAELQKEGLGAESTEAKAATARKGGRR